MTYDDLLLLLLIYGLVNILAWFFVCMHWSFAINTKLDLQWATLRDIYRVCIPVVRVADLFLVLVLPAILLAAIFIVAYVPIYRFLHLPFWRKPLFKEGKR